MNQATILSCKALAFKSSKARLHLILHPLVARVFTLVAALILVLMSGSISVFAKAPAATSAAVALRQALEQVQTWSANFDQIVASSDGQVIQTLVGRLALRKPMQFFWETFEPFPQVVVSNGSKLWIYDEDLEQVVIRPISEAVAPMPATILSGQLRDLDTFFKVTDLIAKPAQAEIQSNRSSFLLMPKNIEDSDFERLQLDFTNNSLSQLRLHDTLGQVTTLTFSGAVLNPPLEAAHFDFQVPANVDVIDETLIDETQAARSKPSINAATQP